MGGCFSDMKGGKQAVGGIREAATGVEPQNDAVDFFYKTQGFQQLFTRVEALDADNGRRLESSSGRAATRDIVQFVSMREVQSGQVSVLQALLQELPEQFLSFMQSMLEEKRLVGKNGGQISAAQTLLEELPEQLLSFVRSRDIKPQP